MKKVYEEVEFEDGFKAKILSPRFKYRMKDYMDFQGYYIITSYFDDGTYSVYKVYDMGLPGYGVFDVKDEDLVPIEEVK